MIKISQGSISSLTNFLLENYNFRMMIKHTGDIKNKK